MLAGRRHAHRSGLGVRSLTFGGRPKNITARSNIQRFHTLPPSPSLPSWWSRPRPSGKHLLSSFTCNSTGYLIWPLWATPHHCLPLHLQFNRLPDMAFVGNTSSLFAMARDQWSALCWLCCLKLWAESCEDINIRIKTTVTKWFCIWRRVLLPCQTVFFSEFLLHLS